MARRVIPATFANEIPSTAAKDFQMTAVAFPVQGKQRSAADGKKVRELKGRRSTAVIRCGQPSERMRGGDDNELIQLRDGPTHRTKNCEEERDRRVERLQALLAKVRDPSFSFEERLRFFMMYDSSVWKFRKGKFESVAPVEDLTGAEPHQLPTAAAGALRSTEQLDSVRAIEGYRKCPNCGASYSIWERPRAIACSPKCRRALCIATDPAGGGDRHHRKAGTPRKAETPSKAPLAGGCDPKGRPPVRFGTHPLIFIPPTLPARQRRLFGTLKDEKLLQPNFLFVRKRKAQSITYGIDTGAGRPR